ncbi:unnamed protein product [Phytomonas sp. EM1]|nr:unnamed protein product [Phytomonas sp. EM1]|eukprot:CCW63808.1 unnamed protein product [Phytomonas sp. isolate EM1]
MQNTKVVKGRYSTYQLKEVLGYGGSATVYLGVDIVTDQLVAVKKMTASDNATVQRWRAEVETLIALRDDARAQSYVIRYLDHMQSNKTIFIVEEYASKGSLLAQLQSRGHGFEEWDAARLMYQIVAALAYIHSRNSIHRDIKCANVLVCDNDEVKLSDFGFAGPSVATLPEGGHDAVGSVYWMSPEMARGESLDPSSDVWSLGCLCVELLTGKPPFADRPPANALHHIMTCQTPPLPSLPLSEDCLEVLKACFVIDPHARPTAVGLLEYRWFMDAKVSAWLDRAVTEKENWQRESPPSEDRVRGVAHKEKAKTFFGRTDEVRLGEWVENCLFSISATQCVRWLRGGNLGKVISILEFITADEAYSILRSFAFAAEREKADESLFLDTLGSTTLWDYRYKTLTKDTPDHLATIFSCCCDKQDPVVPHFAPSHPGAVHFVLHCEHASIEERCIEAMCRLYVGDDSYPISSSQQHEGRGGRQKDEEGEPWRGETGPMGGSAKSLPDVCAGNPELQAKRQQQARRRRCAQQRLIADGGFSIIRRKVVEVCQRAILSKEAQDDVPAREWGIVDRLCQILWETARQTEAGEDHLWGLTSAAVDTEKKTASTTAAAAGGNSEASTAARDGEDASGEHDNTSKEKFGGAAAPTVQWYLSLQEANRHGCQHAIHMLLALLRHLVQHHHDYLKVAGRSLAGGLLTVWHQKDVPRSLRLEALSFLPTLQQVSPRASEFLRDGKGCVPVLAYAIKRCSLDEGESECLEGILRCVIRLCTDKRMAVECANNPLSFIAVGHAVRVAMTCPNLRQRALLASLAVQQLHTLCRLNPVLAKTSVEVAAQTALHCLAQEGAKWGIETTSNVATELLCYIEGSVTE